MGIGVGCRARPEDAFSGSAASAGPVSFLQLRASGLKGTGAFLHKIQRRRFGSTVSLDRLAPIRNFPVHWERFLSSALIQTIPAILRILMSFADCFCSCGSHRSARCILRLDSAVCGDIPYDRIASPGRYGIFARFPGRFCKPPVPANHCTPNQPRRFRGKSLFLSRPLQLLDGREYLALTSARSAIAEGRCFLHHDFASVAFRKNVFAPIPDTSDHWHYTRVESCRHLRIER